MSAREVHEPEAADSFPVSTPEEFYHVITRRFETSAAQYAWLQQVVAIGRGALVHGGIRYDNFAVRYT